MPRLMRAPTMCSMSLIFIIILHVLLLSCSVSRFAHATATVTVTATATASSTLLKQAARIPARRAAARVVKSATTTVATTSTSSTSTCIWKTANSAAATAAATVRNQLKTSTSTFTRCTPFLRQRQQQALLQRSALKQAALRITTTSSSSSSSNCIASAATATATAAANGNCRTGFRQFSQRATRLQARVQKSFSLRAIFSDVVTNHPGSNSNSATTTSYNTANSTSASTSSVPTSDEMLVATSTSIHQHPYKNHNVMQDMQRIATGTLKDSWSGFTSGYILRTAMGMTRSLYSASLATASSLAAAATPPHRYTVSASALVTTGNVLPYGELVRKSQQLIQMHSTSLQFGLEWAQMSAVFGACRLLVQTCRRRRRQQQQQHDNDDDDDDQWNSVGGSCLAGAVFSLLQGGAVPSQPSFSPVVVTTTMMRGALLYGGTMLLLHPQLWGWQQVKQKPLSLSLLSRPLQQIQQQLHCCSNEGEEEEWWDGMQ